VSPNLIAEPSAATDALDHAANLFDPEAAPSRDRDVSPLRVALRVVAFPIALCRRLYVRHVAPHGDTTPMRTLGAPAVALGYCSQQLLRVFRECAL
jgi:hypothetical protein